MAFKANSSSTEVVSDKKLYTGIDLALVKAINPSLEELQALGVNVKKEPVYDNISDDKSALDFWLQFDKIKGLQKVRFFIGNKINMSNNGLKQQMIDKEGKTCWIPKGETSSSYDWIDNESLRPCYIGEERVTNFLINWLNIKPKDEAKIENFTNPVKELRAILTQFKENKVRAMLIVTHADNGNNYQNVYTEYFDRATSTSFNYWEKHINKQIAAGYPIKGTYSYTFQEYKAVEPTSDGDNTSGTSDNDDVNNDLF